MREHSSFSVTGRKEKENIAALPPTRSSGRRIWIAAIARGCRLSLTLSLPCTKSHTLPVFLWIQTERSDVGVENHKESKVGVWSRGAMNWTSDDERVWRIQQCCACADDGERWKWKKIQDWGYVKYGREVGGGLSAGIKVDWVMRSRSRSQARLR